MEGSAEAPLGRDLRLRPKAGVRSPPPALSSESCPKLRLAGIQHVHRLFDMDSDQRFAMHVCQSDRFFEQPRDQPERRKILLRTQLYDSTRNRSLRPPHYLSWYTIERK